MGVISANSGFSEPSSPAAAAACREAESVDMLRDSGIADADHRLTTDC
jgi:hypothetical protein